jgi:hypothetical protein
MRCEQTFLKNVGLDIDRPADHIVFSEGVCTQIFPLAGIPVQ